MFNKKSKNKKTVYPERLVPSSIEGRRRVFVGLSGGVDSSVSAALLKKEGYDVVGVFIKVWQPEFLECTWREDRRDAMRVCAHLDIPFFELDLEEEYKRDVVDYMIEEYKRGRTPNPDVMCNKHIKFGGFLDWALNKGADYVATGHYARIAGGQSLAAEPRLTRRMHGGTVPAKHCLLTGVDDTKDQSYFLWTLTQDQLSKIIFPVGGYRKEYVRKLARKFGLPTAEKKDSQGVCFLGKLDMKEFLKHYIDEKLGDVVNEKGEVIGWHPGAVFFTLGERHGLTITKKGTQDSPFYVISKDINKNTLTVSNLQRRGLTPQRIGGSDPTLQYRKTQDIEIENMNWIPGIPQTGKIYKARIRHLGKFNNCKIIYTEEGNATVQFDELLLASPGQSLVLYSGKECLGGGIIT